MATRGRNSPGRSGADRRDGRPGGQRGFKSPEASRTRPGAARPDGERSRPGAARPDSARSRSSAARPDNARSRPEAARTGTPARTRSDTPRFGSRNRPGRDDVVARNEREVSSRTGRTHDGSDRSGGTGERAGTRSRRGAVPAQRESVSKPSAPERTSTQHGEPERLQKVLARMGVASRREAEQWIRAGRLTVNGEPAVLGTRVGRSDHLRLDGRLIHRHEVAAGQVYLCHRSPGENLRTPEEPSEHQALMDRLPRRAGNRFIAVSPMPRIDGGLEIVTSDGSLALQLQRTVHSLPSEFSVRVKGELEEQTLRSIMEGVLDRGVSLQVESLEPGGGEAANRWYTIVARGGSGKDIRQLFERHGALVSRVLRTKLGPLELDRLLSRGQFRPLTQDEIQSLIASPAAEVTEPE